MKNETTINPIKIDVLGWVFDNSDEITQTRVENEITEIDNLAELVIHRIKMNVPNYVSFSGEILHIPMLVIENGAFSYVSYVKKEMQVTVDYKRSKEGGEPDERISMIDELDFRGDELDGDEDLCDVAGKAGYKEIRLAFSTYVLRRNKAEEYFQRLFNEQISVTL